MSSSTPANPSLNEASPQRYQTPHAEKTRAAASTGLLRHGKRR